MLTCGIHVLLGTTEGEGKEQGAQPQTLSGKLHKVGLATALMAAY